MAIQLHKKSEVLTREKTSWEISLLPGLRRYLLASVRTDYSHSVDFAQYKTYSWIKVSVEDPLWEDRITTAVDSQFAVKGWTKAPEGGDAGVAAYGSTKTQKTLETWYTGFGGDWRWRGFGDGLATTTVENTPVGTLTVDIFDSSTYKLIWRGVASDTLSGKPEEDEKKMDKAVAEMFKNFPLRKARSSVAISDVTPQPSGAAAQIRVAHNLQ